MAKIKISKTTLIACAIMLVFAIGGVFVWFGKATMEQATTFGSMVVVPLITLGFKYAGDEKNNTNNYNGFTKP